MIHNSIYHGPSTSLRTNRVRFGFIPIPVILGAASVVALTVVLGLAVWRIQDIRTVLQRPKAAGTAYYRAISPISGTVVSSLTPSFTWEADTTGINYNNIYVSQNSSCEYDAATGQWLDHVPLTSRQATFPNPLQPNTTYYWNIYGDGPAGIHGAGCQNFRTGAGGTTCTTDPQCPDTKRCGNGSCVPVVCPRMPTDGCWSFDISNHVCNRVNEPDGTVCTAAGAGSTCQNGVCTAAAAGTVQGCKILGTTGDCYAAANSPFNSTQVTLDGTAATQLGNSSPNSYSFSNVSAGSHTVTVPSAPSGYTVSGYSLCYNRIDCHTSLTGSASTISVSVPANGYADLWWHFRVADLTCSPDTTLCGDGCKYLQHDPANCGNCGNVCNATNGTATCNGSCGITCSSGYGNCDGNAVSNGCEVNLNTNTANCGTCGHACTAGQTCTSGVCVPSGNGTANECEVCEGLAGKSCASGLTCKKAANAGADQGGICVKNDGTTKCGPCSSDSSCTPPLMCVED